MKHLLSLYPPKREKERERDGDTDGNKVCLKGSLCSQMEGKDFEGECDPLCFKGGGPVQG